MICVSSSTKTTYEFRRAVFGDTSGLKVTITPSLVTSESWNTFKINIRLGASGLAENDSIGIVCGSNIDRWHFQFASHIWGCYTPWQVTDPAAQNFVSAKCSRKTARILLRIGASGGHKTFHNQSSHIIKALHKRYRYVLEISADRKLAEGDVITVTWGDTTWKSLGVRVPSIALRYYFLPFKYSLLPCYDRELPIRQGNYETLPCIRVKGKPAVRLHIAAQPLLGQGEPFSLHIAAIDRYGNLDEDFVGNLKIKCSDNSATIPVKIVFNSSHKGKYTIKGIQIYKPGWHTIKISNSTIKGESNYLLVTKQKPSSRIYFGEMHGHTLDCDGALTAQDHFDYARNVAGLDFASLSSHAEYFGTKLAWDRYLKAATEANKPRAFVTFYGYEWAGEGHVNAYFIREKDVVNIYGKCILKGSHPKDKPAFRIVCNREQRFLKMLKSLGCQTFAISHYHSYYIDPVDDRVIRLHEIYSVHQQNPLEEKLKGILQRGLKIGVVCGADTHRLPIGHLCPDPDSLWKQPGSIAGCKGGQSLQKKCGLQATFAPELTRKSLWKAMQERLTYGTTGARIVLIFEINGVSMGQEIVLEKGKKPDIHIKVGGTANLREVSVVKYDGHRWSEPMKKENLVNRICECSWKDTSFRSNTIYYLRVIQNNNERAWSSPIWVEN